MTAEITVTDEYVHLHCELCEQYTDCDGYNCPRCEDNIDHDVGFSFTWPREHADTIMHTIELMRDLHNGNYHEGNVTC